MNDPSNISGFDTDHRFTAASGMSLRPVSLEPYRSPAFFEREREQVFARAWLLVAREEEIANPGDYVLKTVAIGNTSILITRTKAGTIKAFHNSCSHRGTEVVMQPSGNAGRFVCPYHNWTYSNEGQLVGVPDERAFFGIDKRRCGLTPVACDVWEGYVFINLQPQPEVSLLAFLGPLAERLKGVPYTFADNSFFVRSEVNANWKIVSDAFLESYHIPAIHPETIGATFASGDNPHARLLDAAILGPHAFVSMYGNPDFQLEERHKIDRVAQNLDNAGSVISASKLSDMEAFLAHPAVNPLKTSGWAMDSIYVFPHVHINWGPGGFWVHWFWPLSHDRTCHEARFFMAKPTSVRQRLQQELYVSRVLEVIAEDLSNMERTQRGVASGAKHFMILQDNEVAIRHVNATIQRWVEARSVEEALSA